MSLLKLKNARRNCKVRYSRCSLLPRTIFLYQDGKQHIFCNFHNFCKVCSLSNIAFLHQILATGVWFVYTHVSRTSLYRCLLQRPLVLCLIPQIEPDHTIYTIRSYDIRSSDVFKGQTRGALGTNGLINAREVYSCHQCYR